MIEQLFGSKTRVKLLHLFYRNPNRSFYVREITRKIDEQINSVRRELANLSSVGIITSDTNDTSNNKLYYEVNQQYEFYGPLLTIFGTNTTQRKVIAHPATDTPEGSTEPLDVTPLTSVDLVLFTGQLTRDERSGIDVLLVGGMTSAQAEKYIANLEAQESKELRYVIFSKDEFVYRQKIKDRFVSLVLESKSQVVLDKHYLIIPKPAKSKAAKEKE